MKGKKNVSVYLSYLLRHHPEDADLTMDKHGWVKVSSLISAVNAKGIYRLNKQILEEIVANDEKGRYRFDEHHIRIKACQGHSVPWVEPEIEYKAPPEYLYHGTTSENLRKIYQSGAILKMSRHAVHMQEDVSKAWQSAERWHSAAVVIKISALLMHEKGFRFGITENDVWCSERIPTEYIKEVLYDKI